LFRGGGFEQDPVHLEFDVLRQQIGEDRVGPGLVDVVDFLAPLIFLQTNDLFTLSLGLQQYQSIHQTAWAYLMAASVVFVLLGVTLLVFLVTRLTPGDPAGVLLGPRATDEQVARVAEEQLIDLVRRQPAPLHPHEGDGARVGVARQPRARHLVEPAGVQELVGAEGARLQAVDHGVIETRPGVPLERRLADIHARVGELLDLHGPAALAVEELYFGANVRTAFAVGQARGCEELDEPLPDDSTGRADELPYVVREPPGELPATPGPGPHPSGRMLVVAGAGAPDPGGLAAYAARHEIPLLADPLSGARRGEGAIAHYDLLLRKAGFTDEHRPDFVFRLGDLPTSKPLRGWLASLGEVPQIAFDPHGSWDDPDAGVGMRLRSRLPQPEQLQVAPGWLDSWREADAAAAGAIAGALGNALSEPLVARELARSLPAEATLYLASSMPIRDAEAYMPARAGAPRMLSNRGANGIDGTVSSALGAAATSGGPTVLLVGDVALVHDLGGLLAARRLGLSLTIVLLNNDGGGIFHFLPVAGGGQGCE